ncbi:helix-turn-helix transcriptional regulator [Magnetovibrio sp.]|uniref:helix-turn-helix domain-containing protein n=1 Tax=Magnetovibrio sp. TaxID=2024836 RepID=UPI002F94ED96
MAQKAMRYLRALSDREAECLSWVANGKTSSEVSQILGISTRTVNFHVNNSMEKLDAMNRTHLIALFVKSYLIGAIEESTRHRKCGTCPLQYGDVVLGPEMIEIICTGICRKKS